jgi:hypothetical protein
LIDLTFPQIYTTDTPLVTHAFHPVASSLPRLPYTPGLFWLKTTVACIGRLGITMAFEMVVFVNTELYPTFVR